MNLFKRHQVGCHQEIFARGCTHTLADMHMSARMHTRMRTHTRMQARTHAHAYTHLCAHMQAACCCRGEERDLDAVGHLIDTLL